MHNKEKISKIISSLIHYFLDLGYKDISFDISYNSCSEILLRIDKLDDNIKNTLLNEIGKEREMQEEEYAWELLGEDNSDSELEILGVLIDKIEIVDEKEKTLIKLSRFN